MEQQGYRNQDAQSSAVADIDTCPALAPNVELIGVLRDGGFADQQYLVQLDGRFIQLTELLYRIAEQANGKRSLEEIAAGVTASTDWIVAADQVRQLIEAKLVPLGLIAGGSGAVPSGSEIQAQSPLRIGMRTRVLAARSIDPIAKALQFLYAPPLLIPLIALVAVAHGWLYLTRIRDIAIGINSVVYTPALLLIVFAIWILAAIFHEFGHAAALRYGGGKVRGMGIGIYLIYPAFYTDTTDSYRLGRWARVRTALGGFYFYLIFALVLIGLYLLSGQEFLLFVIVLINIDILFQSLPFFRFDGYWAFADLTGIPDPFTYMKRFAESMRAAPGSRQSKVPRLKPWVRRVLLAYTVVTIPVLGLALFLFLTRAPRFVAMLFDSYVQQGGALSHALSNGDVVGIILSVTQMLILAVLVLGIGYMFYKLGRKVLGGIWSVTRRRLRVA